MRNAAGGRAGRAGRIFLVPVLLGVVLLGIWVAMRVGMGAGDKEEEEISLPTVIVELPSEGSIGEKIVLPGNLEPYERATLYAKVSGYLERVDVDIGDSVRKDQVLARLLVPEVESSLLSAHADLAKAEAEAELGRLTYERLSTLHQREPGAVTRQDLDVSRAKREIAESDIQVAKARIAELEAVLSYAEIRAPFAGIVVNRFAHTGALMTAGTSGSQPVVELVRGDRLRLVLDVPEAFVSSVDLNRNVSCTLDALPDMTFQGKVSRYARSLLPDTRSMRVEIDIDNHDGKLLPGMYANVHLEVGALDRVFTVPGTAIRVRDGETCVFVVEENVIRKRPVVIVRDDGGTVAVRGDLDSRTPVVIATPPLLEEGEEVRLRHAAARP